MLKNPVLQTYMIAASLMLLKMAVQAWITVFWMIKVKGGYLHPEDIKKTGLNKEPNPDQLNPHPDVERSRALQRNDLENIPIFLIAGMLFVFTRPPLWVAQWLMYGYVISRLLHFWALSTGKIHDLRATFWTIGSLISIGMSIRVLIFALSG